MVKAEETNRIYLLFACNQWKKPDSMQLKVVTKSLTKLRRAIENEIRSGKSMEYTHGEELSVMKQLKLFRSDWKELSDYELNNYLNYGYIQVVADGEIL